MGLDSRRRYRWTGPRITDYWDEVFTADSFTGHAAALDDQSAFIASLGTERSERMRDVLGTIQADQDAVIRAGSSGALVVDGGPGTGKTVVALHRAAYLLYSDPRLGHHRGDVLVVGPSEPYLAYVSDVLPSLGEEGVQTCTLRDLVPGGAEAAAETDPETARLKASADMVRAIEPAARRYEQPPRRGLSVETNWGDAYLTAADWADAFAAAGSGTAHNEARDQVWRELTEIVLAKLPEDAEVSEDLLRRSSPATGSWWPRSTRRGRSSSRATSSPRSGPPRSSSSGAPRTSATPTCSGCSGRTRSRGPCPTCRCSTRPASAWATPRRRATPAAARPRSPPNARSSTGSWRTSWRRATGTWRR
nr:hypothetical protein GCM10025732_52370 [Glycomyces mayteni]